MMSTRSILLFALTVLLGRGEVLAQELTFSKETFTATTMTLPYRKATIPGNGERAALIVYLHGGTSKGNDNEAQLLEPGVTDISLWLADNKRKAIMLVPQCPKDKSWLGPTQDALVQLLQSYVDRGAADAAKVYILGGSMGGTGTWNMISAHPGLFAAAMPVAGNPTGLDAAAVAQTPLYTVMGTADNIMKIPAVQDFLQLMDAYDADYRFDTEDGWTHEDTCKKSYTANRLNWLFAHTRSGETGIRPVTGADSAQPTQVMWHTIGGQRLASAPSQHGIYVKTAVFADGLHSSEKVCL